jgi:tail tube protein
MSFPITTSLRVVKPPQYVIEVVRGTTPGSPTFQHAGPIQEFTPNTETNSVNYRMLGSPDLYKVCKTGERFSFDLTYSPVNRNLLSMGINLDSEDPTYNRDKTLTIMLSQQMNNSGTLQEAYIVATGCSCDSTSIDVSLDAVNVSQTWIANDIPLPVFTSPFTTPTYAGSITGCPWNGTSANAKLLTHNGNDYVLRGFSCTISHNTDQFQPLGETNVFATIPTIRDISGSFDVLYQNSNLATDCEAVTARAATVKLSTDTKLTFTDMYLTSYNETISATATEAKTQSFNFVAKSVKCESY